MAGSEKSEGAFRTIREVADWLAVPTHVLRFWESKFAQIAPVKGAGGRRYYRPDDMRLLGGIKVMLHDQGLTVRSVGQKIDEEGVNGVMALSPELDASEPAPPRARRVIRPEDGTPEGPAAASEAARSGMVDTGTVVSFERTEPVPSPAEVEDPAEDPAEGEAQDQPDAPDGDLVPPQPSDVEEEAQPGEEVEEVASPPQPAPDLSDEPMPGADPAPVASNERGVEIVRPEPPAAAKSAPQEEQTSAAPFDRMERRRLRRILDRLRGLIAQVEDELAAGEFR